jgi:sporulation protein YlmC with PRC-barrel domain
VRNSSEQTARASALLARASQDGEEKKDMAHPFRPRPLAALIYLTLSGPLLAAQPAVAETGSSPPTETAVDAASAASVCRDDIKSFDSQMTKDGYWRSGEGYGFGYPMGAAGFGMYGSGLNQESPARAGAGYRNARPGYEVRVLVHAATILARHGQQQPCEDVLATTRVLYKNFLTDMRQAGKPVADVPDWRERQIRDAVSVTGANVSFRPEELLGVEVRSPSNLALGSVDDLVSSPQTGKIAYLVIARSGILGFDESHVPVPWDDFKATPDGSLLVLDTTKSALDGAPQVKRDTFSVGGDVDSESHKVDSYWKAHQPSKASN